MKSENKKTVLLIGTFRNEKITNEIHLSGREIISKNLTSSPSNWDSIIRLIKVNGDDYDFIALSLNETVLLIAQCEAYRKKFYKIVDLLKDKRHVIFVYEDNLFGKFNIFNTDYYSKYLFYDDFFTNREHFKDLTEWYSQDSASLREDIARTYLFNTIIPALCFAEEEEWERIYCNYIRNSRSYDFEIYDATSMGLTKKDKEINQRVAELGAFFSRLRETMFFSPSEQFEFDLLDRQGKMHFVQEKFAALRKEYTALINENIDLIEPIEKQILNSELCDPRTDREQWEKREWTLFRIYLKEKRYEEDKEIALAIERMRELITHLFEQELNVYSFKYSNDIVLNLRDFLDNEESGIVFRSYILKDQIYAHELDKLLSLFQEYITKIRGVDVAFELRKTDIGTVYVIHSKDKSVVKDNFQRYVDEFGIFLQQCDADIDEVRKTMRELNYSAEEVELYLSRFRTEAHRIQLDLRHEYQLKMLKLRQSIETDIALQKEQSDYGLQTLPDVSPAIPGVLVNSLTIVAKDSAKAQIVFGNPQYNDTDKRLLEYISQLSSDKDSLETELRILKDNALSKNEKRGAFKKLMKFLSDHASDIGSIAFKLFKQYLESQV